jgi:hypothetical protein
VTDIATYRTECANSLGPRCAFVQASLDTTTKPYQYPSHTRYVVDACLTVETAGVERTGPW